MWIARHILSLKLKFHMLMEKFGEAVEGQEIYKLTSEIKLFW